MARRLRSASPLLAYHPKNRRNAHGSLVPYKGFAHLIEAARLLPPDCVVVIVGSGPLHGLLEEQIAAAGVVDRG